MQCIKGACLDHPWSQRTGGVAEGQKMSQRIEGGQRRKEINGMV